MDGFRDFNRPNNEVGFVDLTLRLGLPAFHANENPNPIGKLDLNVTPSSNCHLDQAIQYHTHGDRSGDNNMGYCNISSSGYRGYNNYDYNYIYNENYINNYYPYNIGAGELLSQSGVYLGPNNNNNVDYNGRGGGSGISIGRPSSRHRSAKRARNQANKKDNNDNEDSHRCCSNSDCRTSTTPMWRRGPLGPKTLCNACGIKWRKLVEKMEAEANYRENGI